MSPNTSSLTQPPLPGHGRVRRRDLLLATAAAGAGLTIPGSTPVSQESQYPSLPSPSGDGRLWADVSDQYLVTNGISVSVNGILAGRRESLWGILARVVRPALYRTGLRAPAGVKPILTAPIGCGLIPPPLRHMWFLGIQWNTVTGEAFVRWTPLLGPKTTVNSPPSAVRLGDHSELYVAQLFDAYGAGSPDGAVSVVFDSRGRMLANAVTNIDDFIAQPDMLQAFAGTLSDWALESEASMTRPAGTIRDIVCATHQVSVNGHVSMDGGLAGLTLKDVRTMRRPQDMVGTDNSKVWRSFTDLTPLQSVAWRSIDSGLQAAAPQLTSDGVLVFPGSSSRPAGRTVPPEVGHTRPLRGSTRRSPDGNGGPATVR